MKAERFLLICCSLCLYAGSAAGPAFADTVKPWQECITPYEQERAPITRSISCVLSVPVGFSGTYLGAAAAAPVALPYAAVASAGNSGDMINTWGDVAGFSGYWLGYTLNAITSTACGLPSALVEYPVRAFMRKS